jgi:hypothetical protein
MGVVARALSLAGLVAMLGGSSALAAGSAASPPAMGPPPPALIAVESAAEDIVDLALARDRPRLVVTARQLQVDTTAAIPVLRAAAATGEQLEALRAHAAVVARVSRHRAFIDVALAANAVSRLMPALYARFAGPVPPNVLTLDYLDREAELDSLAGRRGLVTPIVAELARTWAALRSKVLARGGGRQAQAFTAHVAAMRRLAAAAAGRPLQAEAVNGLKLVDELEGVFAP